MPSFDISSEVNMANLTNSIDVASRMIINRYDFKGTSAKVEFSEKELTITPVSYTHLTLPTKRIV